MYVWRRYGRQSHDLLAAKSNAYGLKTYELRLTAIVAGRSNSQDCHKHPRWRPLQQNLMGFSR